MKVTTEPIALEPASPEEADAVRGALEEGYGIACDAVSRYAEKTTSAVYRCSVPGKEPVVVKRIGWTGDLGAIRRAADVGAWLRALGVALPKILKTLDGDTVAKDGDATYQALEHLPGEHFSCRIEEWASAGSALGKLHAAGAALLRDRPSLAEAISRDIPVQMPYEESRAMYLSGLRETFLEDHDCAFPKVCAAFRDALPNLEAAMDSVDSAFAGKTLPSGIVHNDFHTNNGLFLEDGSFSGFLDLDQIGVGLLVWDIGNTLFSFASNAVARGEESRVREFTEAFLEAYGKERPLESGERELIVAAGVRWDLLRIFRSLRRHRFEGDRFPGNIRKIEERLIPRVRKAPEMFGFLDGLTLPEAGFRGIK